MDYLTLALIGLIGLDFALVALAFVLGGQGSRYYAQAQESQKRADRAEAQVLLLTSQVDELKGMVAGADYAMLRASENYMKAKGEIRRLKRLAKGL